MFKNFINFLFRTQRYEILILRGRFRKLIMLVFYCGLLVPLDYFIITEFEKILDFLASFELRNFNDIPLSVLFLSLSILFRPALSWGGTAYSVYISQRILRDIEHDIKVRFLSNREFFASEFELDEITNIYITYGRWFIDSFLLPLIRAILEFAILMTIMTGLIKQYPVEVFIFTLSIFIFLVIYNILTRNILKYNGRVYVKSSENLITQTKNIFQSNSQGNDFASEALLDETLDQKLKSSVILGMFSQGLKNVIEMAAILSFGITIIFVLFNSDISIAIFGTTFVYVIFRILPSITVLLTFYQQRNNARFAIERLGKVFEYKLDINT